LIVGYGDRLLKQLPPEDTRRRYATGIRKAADSAAGLTRQLLAFSRREVVNPKPVDLNVLLGENRELIQRLVGEDVEVVTVLDPLLGKALMDPEQAIQIFLNLAANARDAMPKGGKLTFRTRKVAAGEVPEIAKISGTAILLSVIDTGAGMDETTRQHIFEPFFTTKEPGRGTGLGLSTIYGIVQQCKGWIDFESEAGAGTAFNIYLPCTKDAAAAVASAPVSSHPDRGSETILVVDDRREIRTLMAEILETCGFRVLQAGNGKEALTAAREYPGTIDLLLTDVIMPGMTGRQIADQMTNLRPGIKVLYVSGFSGDAIGNRDLLDANAIYLPKPFTPDTLVNKVQEALGSAKTVAAV
jgi:CheY-like chemotaxis protein